MVKALRGKKHREEVTMEYHPAAGEDGSDDGGTLVLEKR
jgi:hypothetical protein